MYEIIKKKYILKSTCSLKGPEVLFFVDKMRSMEKAKQKRAAGYSMEPNLVSKPSFKFRFF